MSTALITGASSGIGYDLAWLFAQDGHDLVLVARNRDALEKLAGECRAKHGVKAEVIVADLADSSAPARIHDELASKSIAVDFLVNNAGFGTHGPFARSDLAEELNLIQVNVAALVAMTRLILPAMIQRGRGKIMNVASMAGYAPGPFMADYYASKAYVLSYSVALSRELRHKGVTVTALCPGPTRTAFQSRAGINEAPLFRLQMMDSQSVARIGYEGMMNGKTIVIPGLINKLIALTSGLAPKVIQAKIAENLNRDR